MASGNWRRLPSGRADVALTRCALCGTWYAPSGGGTATCATCSADLLTAAERRLLAHNRQRGAAVLVQHGQVKDGSYPHSREKDGASCVNCGAPRAYRNTSDPCNYCGSAAPSGSGDCEPQDIVS